MRLHLHLSIWGALLACHSLAYADYTWNNTGGTGTYSSTDWNTQSNWTGTAITVANKGPQTNGSEAWEAVIFSDAHTLTFNDLALEGWNPAFVVKNNTTVTLNGTISKIQLGSDGAGYINVDSTSKLIWNLSNTNNKYEKIFYVDVQSFKGLEIQKSITGTATGTMQFSLGTLGSIVSSSTSSAFATGLALKFTNTSLLQVYNEGYSKNEGQYTSAVTGSFALYTRKLWEVTNGATIGGSLSSASTFTLSDGTTLTYSSTDLTASAANENKFYLYKDATDGNIYVKYVVRYVTAQHTWSATSDTTWSNTANWADGKLPTGTTESAIFANGNGSTVTIDQVVTPTLVDISGTSYTFVGSGDGAISGDGAVSVNVTGSVTMNLANSYTGGTTVKNGTLIVGTSGTLGTGAVTVASTGTLQIDATGNTSAVSGGVTLNSGTLSFTSGNHTLDQVIGGSSGRLSVSGENTTLTLASTAAQTHTTQTTVGNDSTLQIDVAGNTTAALSGTLTINGGTLAFKTGTHTLNQTIQGSAAKILVTDGASLSITSAQTNAALTTVSNGSSLTLNKNGNGQYSILYGNLNVTGGSTLTTTGGDSFGYNNPASGGFGTLTLSGNSTWNVTNSNTTMGNTTIVLDSSKIVMTCGASNALYGLDLFYGTNTIRTTSSAAGMSSIVLGTNAASGGNRNAVNLRGGTVIFDINRGSFNLDNTTNTADLKVDVILANKASGSTGTGYTKTGDGVMQITKASTSVNAIQIQNGTILLTNDGTLGTSSVTMGGSTGGSAKLAFRYDQEKTFANVISGTGTVTQEGIGNVILTGANTSSTLALDLANSDSKVQLGTAGTASTWGGTVTGNGTLTLVNGTLSQAVAESSAVKLAVNGAQNATINAGGTNGNKFSSIVLGQHSTLTNISGDLHIGNGATESLTMTIDTSNTGTTGAGTSMITLNSGNSLNISDASKLILNVSSVQTLLTSAQTNQSELWITLTNGNLTCSNLSGITFNDVNLSDYGLAVNRIDGGSLVLGLAQIPEPATYSLALLATLGLLSRRRRD